MGIVTRSARSHRAAAAAPVERAVTKALKPLMTTVAAYDDYTGGHSTRVASYAGSLAHLLGCSDDDVSFVSQAGLLHDIGKMGIPENVLHKSGRLSDEELGLMRLQPVLGASILSRIPGMDELIPVVLHHHERWDGLGYPAGLRETDIPIEARIIFVVDAFDAMTTNRPYGEVMSPEAAFAELCRCAGQQFDPMLIDALAKARSGNLLSEVWGLAPQPADRREPSIP